MSAPLDDAALWVAWLALTAPHGGHGLSAMNAARIALGGADDGRRPCDASDWSNCERVLADAPEGVRERMAAVLAGWDRIARNEVMFWGAPAWRVRP